MAISQKVEYMCEVAFVLGNNQNLGYDTSLKDLDVEDLAKLCAYVVDDYFNSNYPYIKEFLDNDLTTDYIAAILERL